ncbi:cupin domain-containing protein [Acidobacteria bacterium AB60]|nr:cupin domain-containing protein [Acidobacteria bacterium AB60]
MLMNQTLSSITEPEPGLRRQVLTHSSTMMLVRHEMVKGWLGMAHRHPHEQMVYVISGRLRVLIDGTAIEAAEGDSFIVPGNAEHQAAALEDSVVLDIFCPAREDYIEPKLNDSRR